MPRARHTVVVVGGGIGGLTAALALQRDGHEVTVVERRTGDEQEGAGISLWPNAMRVLERLGLAAALEASAVAGVRGAIRTRRGRELSSMDATAIEARFGGRLVVVHRGALLTLLRGSLGPDVLRTGAACTGVDADGATAVARLDSGEQLEGDVIVAADGAGSRFRDGPPATPTGLVAWRAVIARGGIPPIAGETWGGGALFGVAPLADDRFYWFASARAGDAALPAGEEHAALMARFGDWHDPIPAILAATTPSAIIRTPLRDLPPQPAWHRGRLVLLGDAVHAMLPNLGQGGCQAIEDGAALAAALRDEPDVATALAAYESARKPRAERVARESRRMSRIALLGNPVAAVRDLAMRATPAGAALRRLDPIVGA
jgi:2-polyprenyl-6-methoxyphenol hydroxylase-like FAD-dependent oxidoreductase